MSDGTASYMQKRAGRPISGAIRPQSGIQSNLASGLSSPMKPKNMARLPSALPHS